MGVARQANAITTTTTTVRKKSTRINIHADSAHDTLMSGRESETRINAKLMLFQRTEGSPSGGFKRNFIDLIGVFSVAEMKVIFCSCSKYFKKAKRFKNTLITIYCEA